MRPLEGLVVERNLRNTFREKERYIQFMPGKEA